MSVILPTWLQPNWDFVDLWWEIITKEEIEHTIDVVNNLPITEHTESIIKAVRDSIVTIIEAETWSGKTTQVPKMLLNAFGKMKKIVVTEPRVIAAIAAAWRVAKELLCLTNDPSFSIWHKVWYRTWKEKYSLPETQIMFATDWLQLQRQSISRLIPDILMIDEAHTFSVATEFLLSWTKIYIEETKRKIKLIIASATIDSKWLEDFFNEVEEIEKAWIRTLKIPWRTFPVEKHFRWWEDFIPSILEQANQGKNILVFVDWKKEIDKTIEELQNKLPNYNIVPLHSELPMNEQTQVLKHPLKPTIVVATDIAQESLTLDYINAVVDNWYHKTLKVRPNWVPELVREPISKADGMQRAWRAWRVMSWTYIWANNISFENLDDFPTWDIENLTLERYVLMSLAIGFDPMKELRNAWNKRRVFVHKPNNILLKLSYDNLKKMWAITSNNSLTKLWVELLNYPLDPNISMMLLNWIDRWCTWNMIDICAILNHKSFIWKWVKWKQFVKWTYKQDSDLIGLSEFLKLVTTREPLKPGVIGKLKEYWVNSEELELFAQYSNNGKEKMLFEIVDLSIIWVKSKKLFEILKTIETLKERVRERGLETSRQEYVDHKDKEHDEKILIRKNNGNLTRNIVRSILSWVSDNIFEWKKNPDMNNREMFFNDKLGRFNPPINTLMDDWFSKNAFYTGLPFIIGWSKEEKDISKGPKKGDWSTPLLFYITKIDSGDISEINHPFLLESFKDIEFWYKEVWKTKRGKVKLESRIKANMCIDLGWLSLSSIIAEIQKEKLEDVLTFTWLPDFMLENNLAVKKYIRSFRKKQKFNIARFRELLTLFTPTIYPLFDMKNLERTLNTYIHDSSVFDAFYRSEDPIVKEFKENPYMEEYKDNVVWKRKTEKINKLTIEGQKRLMASIEEKIQKSNTENEKKIQDAERDAERQTNKEAVLQARNKEKTIQNRAKRLKRIQELKQQAEENWENVDISELAKIVDAEIKTERVNTTNRKDELILMRLRIKEIKEKLKQEWKSKKEIAEFVRIIEDEFNYVRPVRIRKIKESLEEPKELTNAQKAAFEIESLVKNTKHLLNKKKEEWWITKEDLRKMKNEIKIRYWLKIRNTKNSKLESDNERYVEPEKTNKPWFKRKTKIDYMWESIDETVKKLTSEGVFQAEIDKKVAEIQLSFNYIKPEIKPSSVVVKKEEEDNIPEKPTLTQARESLSKKEYDGKMSKLKRQARDENWPKDKFEAEETRLTSIFEETKQTRIEANKNRPTKMEQQKKKVENMKKRK